ncbi:MAG: CCA tRNA nucleotidyltransferase [Candidatus Midichloria sp.]|nr:MAG: CCA tRNA nucleotidyltransferase [Candidatus Midichloria sp.]
MSIIKIHINTIPVLKELLCLYNLLKVHGEVKLVGGCVRDMLLGLSPKDIDLATTILPQEVIKILSQNQIKYFPTGLKFGTVTAVINYAIFEITTLRKDVKTYGRKAEVEFTEEWLEDAKRRDFTVNAIYSSIDGTVVDFFNGIEDLKNKKIKFIGNAEQRIKEDFLRILRYFRFIAYIGGNNIDENSLAATIKLRSGLEKISGERIKAEMFKLLSNPFAKESIFLFRKTGIDENIDMPELYSLPELNFVVGNVIVNLTLILKALKISTLDLGKLFERWRLSTIERKELSFLKDYQYPWQLNDEIKLHQREFYKLRGYFKNAILIKASNEGQEALLVAEDLISSSTTWYYPDFPVTGEDLMKLGITGPKIGQIKNILLENWIENDFLDDKSKLLDIAAKISLK